VESEELERKKLKQICEGAKEMLEAWKAEKRRKEV